MLVEFFTVERKRIFNVSQKKSRSDQDTRLQKDFAENSLGLKIIIILLNLRLEDINSIRTCGYKSKLIAEEMFLLTLRYHTIFWARRGLIMK